MAIIAETPWYNETIYLIENTDRVLGGTSGAANQAAIGLANRTAWLKAQIALLETQISNLWNDDTNHGTRIAALENLGIAGLAARVAALESGLQNTGIDALAQRIAALEQSTDDDSALASRITALESAVQSIDVAGMNHNISRLLNAISVLASFSIALETSINPTNGAALNAQYSAAINS